MCAASWQKVKKKNEMKIAFRSGDKNFEKYFTPCLERKIFTNLSGTNQQRKKFKQKM